MAQAHAANICKTLQHGNHTCNTSCHNTSECKGGTATNTTCATGATVTFHKLAPNSSRTAPEGMSGLGLTHLSIISSWILESNCRILLGLLRAGGVILLTPGPSVLFLQGRSLETTLVKNVSEELFPTSCVGFPCAMSPVTKCSPVSSQSSAMQAQQCSATPFLVTYKKRRGGG